MTHFPKSCSSKANIQHTPFRKLADSKVSSLWANSSPNPNSRVARIASDASRSTRPRCELRRWQLCTKPLCSWPALSAAFPTHFCWPEQQDRSPAPESGVCPSSQGSCFKPNITHEQHIAPHTDMEPLTRCHVLGYRCFPWKCFRGGTEGQRQGHTGHPECLFQQEGALILLMPFNQADIWNLIKPPLPWLQSGWIPAISWNSIF